MATREAVIVDAVRTPIGKRNGALSGWHPADLLGHVLTALVQRSGVDPEIRAPTPDVGRTPVIPPPGSPGGDQSVRPK